MRTVLLAALFCCACATESPPAPSPWTPVPVTGDDCTLATPLVPGIPGSPGHRIPSPRNPNGDSELSALMRRFVDDWYQARQLLEAGKAVPPRLPTHRRMRCSWTTKPEDRSPVFDGMAQAYLAAVQAFDAEPGKARYNAVIQSCTACHSVTCGGPLEFIGAMKWD